MIEVRHVPNAVLLWIDKTTVTVEVDGDTLMLWHLKDGMPKRQKLEEIRAKHFPNARRIKYERDTVNGRRYVTINLRNCNGENR
jgi:hypothetical protein